MFRYAKQLRTNKCLPQEDNPNCVEERIFYLAMLSWGNAWKTETLQEDNPKDVEERTFCLMLSRGNAWKTETLQNTRRDPQVWTVVSVVNCGPEMCRVVHTFFIYIFLRMSPEIGRVPVYVNVKYGPMTHSTVICFLTSRL